MTLLTAQPQSVPEPDTVALALDLLGVIADDPMIQPSYRTAARRHLRELEQASRPTEGQKRLAG